MCNTAGAAAAGGDSRTGECGNRIDGTPTGGTTAAAETGLGVLGAAVAVTGDDVDTGPDTQAPIAIPAPNNAPAPISTAAARTHDDADGTRRR